MRTPLRALFAHGGISVDKRFFVNVQRLKEDYDVIQRIYNAAAVAQFVQTTTQSIFTKTDVQFEGFPHQNTFRSFYKRYDTLVYNLIHGIYRDPHSLHNIRTSVITRALNDLSFVIHKYDYYMHGV